MRTSTPSWLLGALGALTLTVADPAAAADPSQWTCELCPFEDKAVTTGTVDVGIGGVDRSSARFGDYRGLDDNGAFPIAGATLRHRTPDGTFARLDAGDLGLDTRSLAASAGREGVFSVRLRHQEIPHLLTDTALTPFAGSGSGFLTLPPGFPGATTADMPLDATLQRIELGTKRKRTDLGATVAGPERWTFRIDTRHDERKGTLRGAGSFFTTTSQFALPVDHVTDQLQVSASYAGTRLNASLAYHASAFRNHDDALTWQNPFTPAVPGATAGQLALAPDNQFHQVSASAGYQVNPALRASAELAVGRMLQDQDLLAPTLNPNVAVPTLPVQSLDARADTLDASVRVSYAATDRLRLAASATRNERDNRTPSFLWPTVSTDLFVGAASRANLPYSFTRDRLRLTADWRGPRSLTLAGGVEHDSVDRTLQETTDTREATVWLRAAARPHSAVGLSFKVLHAQRDNTGYGVVAATDPPQNPLMRKFNQADRERNAVGLRADANLGESVALGVLLDLAADDYQDSPIGLTDARSGSLGADLTYAITGNTQLRAFGHTERTRSRMLGSQSFALPDWTGRVRDSVHLLGLGVTHAMLGGKLELGADATATRARSRMNVDVGATGTPFPTQRTFIDSVKLSATWHMKQNLSLIGSVWHERYDARDWKLDGLLPATVSNFLAFGEQTPDYDVNVVRVALRYRF